MKFVKEALRSPLVRKSGIAVIDQALLSALNFLIAIILIKTVAKAEFGYYSILYPIALFAISIQNAIVNTPFTVLLASKKNAARRSYIASLFYGQVITVLPLLCLALLIIALLRWWGFDSMQSWLGAALCVAMAGMLCREFLRCYYYAQEQPQNVLKMDIYYIAVYFTLIALAYTYAKMSVPTVFLIITLSSLLVATPIIYRQRWSFQRIAISESFRENWKFGRWTLLGVLVTHIQTYGYLYLLGALLSSTAVAEVSASRLLMMPLVFIHAGWSRVSIPHGSKLREQGQMSRVFKEQAIFSLVAVVAISVYVAILLSLSGFLKNFLFSEEYAKSFEFLVFWAAIFVVAITASNASFGLQVLRDFKAILKINIVSMLVTLGCSYVFILRYGINGAFSAVLIGELLLATGLWFYFSKNVFATSPSPPVALPKDMNA